MDLFSLNWLLGESSQVEKMVRITPIYKRWKGQFGRGPTTRSFGELINIVISHLLNGSKWDDPPRLSGRGGQPKVYFTYHATSWTIQDVFFFATLLWRKFKSTGWRLLRHGKLRPGLSLLLHAFPGELVCLCGGLQVTNIKTAIPNPVWWYVFSPQHLL